MGLFPGLLVVDLPGRLPLEVRVLQQPLWGTVRPSVLHVHCGIERPPRFADLPRQPRHGCRCYDGLSH